jgi:ankyrin repeat protein
MVSSIIANEFNLAVWEGETERVHMMLGEFPELADMLLPGGDTALCRAAYQRHLRIVQILLDLGVSVNKADANGDSPLLNACMGGSRTIIKLLLDRGATSDEKCEVFFRQMAYQDRLDETRKKAEEEAQAQEAARTAAYHARLQEAEDRRNSPAAKRRSIGCLIVLTVILAAILIYIWYVSSGH